MVLSKTSRPMGPIVLVIFLDHSLLTNVYVHCKISQLMPAAC